MHRISTRLRLRARARRTILGGGAALAALVALPAAAQAASITANVSLQGAGAISAPSYGCASGVQNDASITACPSRTVDTGVFGGAASITFTATPSPTPAGHWRLASWTGCDAVAGNQCTVTAGIFTNQTRTVRAVFDDFVAPTVSGLSETFSTTTERQASFTWSTNEGTSSCRVDDTLVFLPCSPGTTRTFASEGPHTLHVRAADASGNVSSVVSRTITIVDTEIVGGPAPGSTTTSRSATFGFTSGAGTAFDCSLDGAAFAPCNPSSTFGDLALGEHTLRVRARTGEWFDRIPAQRTWTIEAAPPSDPPAEQPREPEAPPAPAQQPAPAAAPAPAPQQGASQSAAAPVALRDVVRLALGARATRRGTTLSRLVVRGVPQGATVRVSCSGRGCPRRSLTVSQSGDVALGAFTGRRLQPGARLRITVSRPGATSVTHVITIRRGRAPARRVQ